MYIVVCVIQSFGLPVFKLTQITAVIFYRPWWRHQMETFSALLALYAGNSPVPVNSPHKGQWRGALIFSLICAWINDRVKNREAGDLRRYRGHYDVIVTIKGVCGIYYSHAKTNQAKCDERSHAFCIGATRYLFLTLVHDIHCHIDIHKWQLQIL